MKTCRDRLREAAIAITERFSRYVSYRFTISLYPEGGMLSSSRHSFKFIDRKDYGRISIVAQPQRLFLQ
jgi:NAD dependent epimerase/dehydratase family enzyme